MRVAIVVPGGVDRSGERRVIPALLSLIGRLSQRHDVHVFALTQEDLPGEWSLAGARIHNIGVRRTRSRAVREICRVHAATPVDVVHAIWSGSCGLVAVAVAKLLGIPSQIHIAGGELVALPEIGYGGRLTWRSRLREAIVLRGTSAITAASVSVIQSLHAIGLSGTRVPLGVDLGSWPPREPVCRDPGRAPRLIHVASLNEVKDQATLLRALDWLARQGIEFEMDIIGEDVLAGRIQRLARQYDLSRRLRFTGFLPQRELRPYMERADLHVISSRHETGPLVVLEAAVAGVPTVGTAVGHVAEWAPQAAVAVGVGDWAGLGSEIAKLLQDEKRRQTLGREALQRASRENADFTASCFEALYAETVRKHGGSPLLS